MAVSSQAASASSMARAFGPKPRDVDHSSPRFVRLPIIRSGRRRNRARAFFPRFFDKAYVTNQSIGKDDGGLLDIDMTVVSLADEQLPVRGEDPERRLEIPLPVRIAVAADDNAMGEMYQYPRCCTASYREISAGAARPHCPPGVLKKIARRQNKPKTCSIRVGRKHSASQRINQADS